MDYEKIYTDLDFFSKILNMNLELTIMQRNILEMYIERKSDIEIARNLFIEIYDVKNALRSVRSKFQKFQKNSLGLSY